jgi:hypothetical protein
MSQPSALRGRLESRLRSLELSDVFFAFVVLGFTYATARIWWITTIVPGMDYPQFLLFVRALEDYTDPSSPFHGTYTVGHWYMPTSLPINLTSLLAHLCGGSIEAAGKLLLTLQNVGLVAGTLYLLKLLGRNRWAVLLLFPVIHSSWTTVGGFAAYATSLPLNVLAWALTVRWLHRLDLRSGIALAVCLCLNLLWHGVGFAQAGIGFAVLWAIWRAPSWRARFLSVVPTLPCLVQCAAWMRTTFADKASRGNPPDWTPPWEASERIFQFIWATVPHYAVRALLLFLIVGAGLLLSPTNLGGSGPTSKIWRVKNPFLILSLAYLASYYACPMYLNKVEGVSCRFPYVALLAFIFAWNLPSALAARAVVVAAVGAFAAWCLRDMTKRFVAFDEDTVGASDLMNQIGLHETLYYSPPGEGASKDFDGPTNKPTRELQQYASIRHGGLPNSSFAGYGINYIKYVDGNPMPGLSGMGFGPQMAKFDYVLTRAGSGPNDSEHFTLFSRVKGWELYAVCGSHRFPTCP